MDQKWFNPKLLTRKRKERVAYESAAKSNIKYWSPQSIAGCPSDHKYFYSYTNVLVCQTVKVLKKLTWFFSYFFYRWLGDPVNSVYLVSFTKTKHREIQQITDYIKPENYSISISRISKPIAAQQINITISTTTTSTWNLVKYTFKMLLTQQKMWKGRRLFWCWIYTHTK